MKSLLYSLCFLLSVASLFGQKTDIPLQSLEYRWLDYQDATSKRANHTTVKPISRKVFVETASEATPTNQSNWIMQESAEYADSSYSAKPILKHFFQNGVDFYSSVGEGHDFHLNPVSLFGFGKENSTSEWLFQNYRGLELRGTIDNRISFYSLLTENQARYPAYVKQVTDSTLGVPYEGFWKQYEVNGVDFLRAQGYIDFQFSRQINGQFGFGKHFIGDGFRSLILSDLGNNYPYLRIQTEIGRVQYTNIFAQLTGETRGGTFGLSGIGSFTRKYLAMHHLSWQIAPAFTLGFFESVIFGKPDSLGSNGWRVEYLNPIIFYRAVEQQDGSSDNAMIGLDFKWKLWQSVSVYGQLVIDELVVSEVVSRSDWWGNKQGYQLGAKVFDVFSIDGLALQMEANSVRPYVYAHESNFTSYSHYNQPLAHPLGANFQEIYLGLEYPISDRLQASAKLLMAQYGNDRDSLSYGRDILKPYTLKTGEYGVALLQGNKVNLTMTQLSVSYRWASQLYTDLEYTYRKESPANSIGDFTTNMLSFTLRYHFPYRSYLF